MRRAAFHGLLAVWLAAVAALLLVGAGENGAWVAKRREQLAHLRDKRSAYCQIFIDGTYYWLGDKARNVECACGYAPRTQRWLDSTHHNVRNAPPETIAAVVAGIAGVAAALAVLVASCSRLAKERHNNSSSGGRILLAPPPRSRKTRDRVLSRGLVVAAMVLAAATVVYVDTRASATADPELEIRCEGSFEEYVPLSDDDAADPAAGEWQVHDGIDLLTTYVDASGSRKLARRYGPLGVAALLVSACLLARLCLSARRETASDRDARRADDLWKSARSSASRFERARVVLAYAYMRTAEAYEASAPRHALLAVRAFCVYALLENDDDDDDDDNTIIEDDAHDHAGRLVGVGDDVPRAAVATYQHDGAVPPETDTVLVEMPVLLEGPVRSHPYGAALL